MKIPDAFLGTGPAVAQRMRKLARTWQRGDVLTDDHFGPFVDASKRPDAVFFVDQVNRKDPGEHFHCYALFDAVVAATDFERAVHWFPWFLQEPWRFLGVLGVYAQFLVNPGYDSLRDEYLRTALRFGPELDREGARFQYILAKARFSTLAAGVFVVLERSGVKVSIHEPEGVLSGARRYFERTGA